MAERGDLLRRLSPRRRKLTASPDGELPFPPLKMMEAVGPTDPAAFDNPAGTKIFPHLSDETYDSVFDFGCGCGRLARQLIQQHPRPRAYLGVDLNRPLIEWCQANLSPHAPEFVFGHHDVRYESWNPGEGKPDVAPFPASDNSHSLVIAWSVFTHLTQVNAEYYFGEVKRILGPGGVFYSTWFLFDKQLFPMMQSFQDTLYINDANPTNAVIFDRRWLVDTAAKNGLVITAAEQPDIRGFHWRITMEAIADGAEAVELPPDEAPISAAGRAAPALEPDFSADA